MCINSFFGSDWPATDFVKRWLFASCVSGNGPRFPATRNCRFNFPVYPSDFSIIICILLHSTTKSFLRPFFFRISTLTASIAVLLHLKSLEKLSYLIGSASPLHAPRSTVFYAFRGFINFRPLALIPVLALRGEGQLADDGRQG